MNTQLFKQLIPLNADYEFRMDLIPDHGYSTRFPDGQHMANLTFLDNKSIKSGPGLINFIWSWAGADALIGAAAVLRKRGIAFDLYMPYMFGARSDRQFGEFQPNYFRDVMAPVLNGLGARKIITLDPHSDVVEACLPNVHILTREPVVMAALQTIRSLPGHPARKLCLVVPDAGAVKKAHDIEHMFDDVVYASKHRDIKTGAILDSTINKTSECDEYVIVDDICDGGATFLALARVIRKREMEDHQHTKPIRLVVTHGLFSKGLDTLMTEFASIHTTNSALISRTNAFNFHNINVW